MNSLKKKENLAALEMLLCAAMWSTAGIFIKMIPWSGLAIAGWRSFIAALCAAAYAVIFKKKVRFTKKTFLAGFFMAVTFLCFVVSNKLTTAANAIVLQFTAPVFLLVLSALFLGRKIRRPDAAVVAATLCGMALFFVEQLEGGHLAGNFVAVGTGLSMGCMYLFIGEGDEAERLGGLFIGHGLTALVGIPAFFAGGVPEITGTAVFFIAALGVFQLGVPYILYLRSSKYCSALTCSLLAAAEPLLNPVWVFIFDGEAPGVFALIGGAVVIGSVTLWCVWQGKHSE